MGRPRTIFTQLRQHNSWMSDETHAALERIKRERGTARWRILEVMGRLAVLAHEAEARGGRLALLDAEGRPEVILTLPQLLEGVTQPVHPS